MTKLEPANGVDEVRAILTVRELEVLGLICKGLSNKQIAQRLQLSEGTVKQHVNRILSKAGLENRYKLMAAIC